MVPEPTSLSGSRLVAAVVFAVAFTLAISAASYAQPPKDDGGTGGGPGYSPEIDMPGAERSMSAPRLPSDESATEAAPDPDEAAPESDEDKEKVEGGQAPN
jgi:hypothetical protein